MQQGYFGNMNRNRNRNLCHPGHAMINWQQAGNESPITVIPVTDVREEEDKLIFTMEIPGVKKGDVELKVNDERMLSLVAKKYNSSEVNEDGEKPEPIKVYKRNFKFNNRFDLDNIHASHGDGVLKLTINEIQPIEKEIEIN